MMAALEVTAVEIYGELTPDVEAMVAGMNPTRFVPERSIAALRQGDTWGSRRPEQA
jgi:hypothetical protein